MTVYLKAQNSAVKALDYDPSVVDRDLEASLQDIRKLPKSDQARVIATMQIIKSHDWMTTSKSSVLFINFNTSSNGKSSSFIPAKLVQSVNTCGFNNDFAISFFCNAHLKDPENRVAFMMRSFIAQLLRFYEDFDVDTLHLIRLLDVTDVHTLCQTFYQLILQLPSNVVPFCIADAVTSYETRDFEADASEIAVARLIDIVRKTREHGCVFKLLLTSVKNSHRLYKLMPDQTKDVVWMPSRVSSTGGFTTGKWNAIIGRHFNWLGG